MLHTIENEFSKVTISEIGAEPQSIVVNGVERLWEADPAVWGKHAPLLFPLIGRLRDGYYELDGQPVQAPKHGFCRERLFEVALEEPTRVVFRTVDDEETRTVFPFSFSLEVEYSLEGNTLTKTHRVHNHGPRPMPFELGGHEAYALLDDNWQLEFQGIEAIPAYGMDESGALTLPLWNLPLPAGCLRKTPEELGIDTFVMENVPGGSVTLQQGEGACVTVDLGDFPYLGLWTMAGVGKARYLCVEPWSALPDGHFMSRELREKPGVVQVQPGETRSLSYGVTFA